MGWKSTTYIKRSDAELLISEYIGKVSDEKLEDVLESMGFGDDPELPYCGYNFWIREEE